MKKYAQGDNETGGGHMANTCCMQIFVALLFDASLKSIIYVTHSFFFVTFLCFLYFLNAAKINFHMRWHFLFISVGQHMYVATFANYSAFD